MKKAKFNLAVLASLIVIGTAFKPAVAQTKAANPLDSDTIAVDGKKLTLSAEGINNRMPTIGPRTNTGIYFIIRLSTTDRSPLPKDITFDTVHGIQGEKKWETKKFDGPRGNAPSMVEIVARNAPAWTVSSKIDVVVKLRDSAKKEHLIRAAGVGAMEVH
jgi:hypothetical protein